MGLIGKIIEPCDEELAKGFYNKSDSDSAISFYLNREPSFFEALNVEGYNPRVFSLINEENNKIAGAYIRSLRDCFIDGQPETAAYFSSIKIDLGHRGGWVLNKILMNLHSLIGSDPKLYFCSIMEDNLVANKIFRSGRNLLPVIIPIGKFKTLIFIPRKQKLNPNSSITITNAGNININDLIAFLNKEGAKKQLFPVYKTEHFTNTQSGLLKGIDLNKLYIALKGNRIVGSLGVWDQGAFRQWMFYCKNSFNLIRPAVNLYSMIRGTPCVPRGEKRMPYRYCSLICIEDDCQDIFETLFYYAINQEIALGKKSVLVLGYPENNPMYFGIKVPALKLKSNIFVFAWKENLEYLKCINFDNFYIETAAL
jgi:hypothetical protein